MCTLINEVGNGNHHQWNGGENGVNSTRSLLRKRVPSQEYPAAGERQDSERNRYCSLTASKMTVHLTVMGHEKH